MRKLSNQKKEEILNCIQLLHYGDRIDCDGTYLSVYNSAGFLLETISLVD